MKERGFAEEMLEKEQIQQLKETARLCRGDILTMTTLASSGHPGGSLSSIDIYLVLYSYAKVAPNEPYHPSRDRIVVSHGHTSPAVYSVLGRVGFIDIDEAIVGFRKATTLFEGHIVRTIPGVEWSTGNLGQGLSAGCGFALASKLKNEDYNVLVAMSDGEQTKGQVGEARRFAKKYNLTNLTVIIDYNRLQISGWIHDVMPQRIKENYQSDGWKVIEIDGHDYQQIYEALRGAVTDKDNLVAIIAHTTMGKGVSFMEDRWEFHGKALKEEQYKQAMEELGVEDNLEKYRQMRKESHLFNIRKRPEYTINIDTGKPFTYSPLEKIDNRGAFGKAVCDIGKLNFNMKGRNSVAVLDCDLATSVKTDAFAQHCTCNFFQGGVQEHNTATIAGALSVEGVVTFFADFGVFGIDETYNQHRLNDMNHTNLKLICTHCGLDVGEDGKTHQCIDYIGIMRNLFGYRIIVPADPNHTDRVIRYIATEKGNFIIPMGRSKLPIILSEDGSPYFGENYQFKYGKADILRKGRDATIITCGTLVGRAVKISDSLKERGYSVRVMNFSCLSDIDRDSIKDAAKTGLILTYEDHLKHTGLGSLVAQVIAEEGISTKFIKRGIDHYGESGKPDELYRIFGLDEESIIQTILSQIKSP
ncbi:MAG TPA: transketolase [Candidatus Omnitrophica bacterium]|nr:transketolase [Candidatus Omnitrophota bacterium]